MFKAASAAFLWLGKPDQKIPMTTGMFLNDLVPMSLYSATKISWGTAYGFQNIQRVGADSRARLGHRVSKTK